MKMRELEQRTGVDREVIRIMLRKGLIPEPTRPARNLADYNEAHVRAISTVRELQRESRLTLDEIKSIIDGKHLEGRTDAGGYRHLENLLALRFGLHEPRLVPVAAIEKRYPQAERDARAFARMGMLSILEGEAGPQLTLTDARLVEIWGAIREAGFVEESGFAPENIAFYLKAANEVAAREAAIFFQGSAGKITDERAAEMLQTALPLMLDFFGLLRIRAFIRNLTTEITC
jgi:DNA-binding transcriptional MerR regulator